MARPLEGNGTTTSPEDRLSEAIRRVKSSRGAWLELVGASLEVGASYEDVAARMRREGVSPPTKPYWRTLTRVYVWARDMGLSLEEVSTAGVSKVDLISKLPLTPEEARQLVAWSREATTEQVRKRVQESLTGGILPDYEGYKEVKVPAGVHEAMTRARARMARIYGIGPISEVQFLEFFSEIALLLDEDVLRKLWLSVYGEAEERFMDRDIKVGI